MKDDNLDWLYRAYGDVERRREILERVERGELDAKQGVRLVRSRWHRLWWHARRWLREALKRW